MGAVSPPIPTHRRRWVALAFACLAVVVIVMDGSIVNVALPTLGRTLADASISRLQWVVDAYILVFAALLLTAGSVSDRVGRKAMLLAGLAVFAGVSIGAAMSGSAASLVAWRALMGIGAAMIFPSTLAIIADAFPEPHLRRVAIALWAGSSGLGVAIGPVAGGWLLTHHAWGSIFLVNLPVCLVAGIGVALSVRESRDAEPRPFDTVGSLLAATGILALVWALIEAPERGWLSPACAGGGAAAAVLLAAFVAWERRVRHPMLEMHHFTRPAFAGGCLALAAAFFGLFGFVFMVTQFFQYMRGYSALECGVRTLPFAAFILVGALMAAPAQRRVPQGAVLAVGLALLSMGFAWGARLEIDTPYSLMVWQMGVLGIGLGIANASATEAIMGSLPVNRAGTGSSVNDTLRELGGTLGVAGMGSAFNALYRDQVTRAMSDTPLPESAQEAVRSSLGGAMTVVEGVQRLAGAAQADLLREAVQRAFLDGFRASCWIACGVSAVGAVAVAWVMRRRTANSSVGVRACA